ncbi:AP-1 complex subunit gamma-2 [Dendrobium catenatum]|uniref:AP-1 complex subunit gamma n=1 Tax=Dendrobium catenatum TaxID=906689 RepID=A0A2I0VJ50_9ASPA|nr:AP-1 complex subunit gamma-2 [Dendrobium catenatum]
MNPFSSGTRLRDMIRAIRACKTAAEERAVVRKECAAIRAAVSDNDQEYRHRNLAKLMFIHMLGYPTHFGQMECLKLIASAGFPEKRIGYLGLMLLLDERQEVLMLVTNSLKQYPTEISTIQTSISLVLLYVLWGIFVLLKWHGILLLKLNDYFKVETQTLRKKFGYSICAPSPKQAALCSIRIVRKVPDLAENFMSPAAALLKEKHHGVLIAGVQLCADLCKASSEALGYLRKNCTEGSVRILRDVSNSSYAPEYDISGITDPFLHIRVLKLMRMLGQGDVDASEFINDILAQVATKIESNKNAGNAILYECVETIMGIEATGGLRVLAINILGRFLSNRDNNIRYVALNMLMKSVVVDSQAMQRHRTTILECVKDSDASIRKRALELVCLLVNDTNVKPLTKELIDYLEVSDEEFKGDLTEKICSIVERFSSEKLWYIDQMLKILSEAGNHVKDEVWHSLIVVISNAADLQGYTVRSLYKAFQTSSLQVGLVRVALWCIGEYGEMLVNGAGMLAAEEPVTVTESDAIDVVEVALKSHSSDFTIRAMSLIALLKLSSLFACFFVMHLGLLYEMTSQLLCISCRRIRELIIQHKGNFELELQQRSIEFNNIIQKHKNIQSSLVERMPVLDESTYLGRKDGSSTDVPAVKPSKANLSGTSLNLQNGVTKPPAASMGDLLDLSSDDVPATKSSTSDFLQDLLGIDLGTPVPSGAAFSGGSDILMDLLSIGSPIPNDSSPPNSVSSSVANSSAVALDKFSSLTSTSSSLSSEALTIDPLRGIEQIIRSPPSTAPIVDLLDGFSNHISVSGNEKPDFPAITAFESNSLKIAFSFTKLPGRQHDTQIKATFTNKSSNEYTDFIFQAAVPKFIQLHLDPASSSTLPASGKGSITQTLSVTNSQHGQKPLAMRVRMAYKVNNQDLLEQGQITSFPPGL